jgi:hypothetical protein
MIYLLAFLGIGGGFAGLAWFYLVELDAQKWRELATAFHRAGYSNYGVTDSADLIARVSRDVGPFSRENRKMRDSLIKMLNNHA